MTDAVRIPVTETVVVRVATGQPGTPGADAYQVAVANGFVGTVEEWLESLGGDPGNPGTAGTITVGTVTTGAPGTDVEVENVGTASAALLNFTIPEGQPGEDAVGGGSGAWGDITGTLTDQTDLADALDGKSDVGHTHSADDIVDGTTNRVFTAADDTKLAGVASGATANASDATLLARANHTGTQSADTLTDGTTNKAFLATERTKLAGIATSATANDTDANLKARANHTGTQLASTISDFSAAADARVTAGITGKLDTSAAPELIRDTIGTALVAGSNVTITVNDAGDTITIAASSGAGAYSPAVGMLIRGFPPGSSTANVNQRLTIHPLVVEADVHVDAFIIEATGTSGNGGDLGVYPSNSDGTPNFSSGPLASVTGYAHGSATTTATFTAISLPKGIYWVALRGNNTTPTYRAYTSAAGNQLPFTPSGWGIGTMGYLDTAQASLPSGSFTPTKQIVGGSGGIPAIGLRISSVP